MSKDRPRLTRLGVLAPAALSACIDASVLAAPAAGAILSTVLKELSKAFLLKKWFHGMMTAEEAEILLMQKGKNGSYLVRESQTHPGEFVLSVRIRGRVSHVMIRRERNKYNVGSGESFEDLTGLIEHCRAYPLTETSGDVLRLLQPVSGSRTAAPTVDVAAREEKGINNMEVEVSLPDSEIGAVAGYEPSVQNGSYGEFVSGGLSEEFTALSQVEASSTFTTIEGNRRENQYKNRYRNVLPYDQTRVVLPHNNFMFEDLHGDYINANFIRPSRMFEALAASNSATSSNESLYSTHSLDLASSKPMETTPLVSKSLNEESLREAKKMFKMNRVNGNVTPPGVVSDKFYIATQGCLRTTVYSFWSMIISHDVRVIAMITKMVENGKRKCARYWPHVGERERYGDIQVYTVQETAHSFYILREFEVTTETTRRLVFQYQFTTWPDHHTLTDTKDILTFIDVINKRMLLVSNDRNPPNNNILCVHCSAGIGRTGTFIALDMLIDQVKTEGLNVNLDIFNTVKVCRFQRAGMVQSKLQYSFLYAAMGDYLREARDKAERVGYYGSLESAPKLHY